MRKLFKESKLFKGGNYMRKYGIQPTPSTIEKKIKSWGPQSAKVLFNHPYP